MEPLHSHELNFVPVFIGGSPRSGTTMLNSLVCSSKDVNQHMQESSYFAWNIQPLKLAMSTFKKSQGHYFQSPEQLQKFHGDILKQILIATWQQEGCPKKLCLKNPNMVKDFALMALLTPTAQFIAIVRDPVDIIASRYEAEKRGNAAFGLTQDFVNDEIDNINEIHTAILEYLAACTAENMLVIEYEKLVNGLCLETMKTFLGLPDIDLGRVWLRTKENMHSENSQWVTSLYGAPIQDSSVGRHKQVLPAEVNTYIKEHTAVAYNKVQSIAQV